jgi:hypothetical protein
MAIISEGSWRKAHTTTSAKEDPLQQPRSQPVNATRLSEKLQVVLTQHTVDKADYFATDDNDDES